MLGCRCGAKWNAAEWVDEAVAGGAELRTRARVERVTIEGGQATGVEGRIGGQPFRARAKTVVVAAGGIGTPRLLQASGLREAGEGLTMDATLMVYGFVQEEGIGHEPPMTWSYEDPDAGYMLSTLIDPWLLYPIMTALKSPRHALTWPRWRNVLGVMIKLKDEVSGGVFPDGRIRKPLTPAGPRAPGAGRGGVPQDPGPRRGGAVLDLLDAAARHAPERHGAHRDARGHATSRRRCRASTSATPASSPRRSTARPC